jgi:hypothetical protein
MKKVLSYLIAGAAVISTLALANSVQAQVSKATHNSTPKKTIQPESKKNTPIPAKKK